MALDEDHERLIADAIAALGSVDYQGTDREVREALRLFGLVLAQLDQMNRQLDRQQAQLEAAAERLERQQMALEVTIEDFKRRLD